MKSNQNGTVGSDDSPLDIHFCDWMSIKEVRFSKEFDALTLNVSKNAIFQEIYMLLANLHALGVNSHFKPDFIR